MTPVDWDLDAADDMKGMGKPPRVVPRFPKLS